MSDDDDAPDDDEVETPESNDELTSEADDTDWYGFILATYQAETDRISAIGSAILQPAMAILMPADAEVGATGLTVTPGEVSPEAERCAIQTVQNGLALIRSTIGAGNRFRGELFRLAREGDA